MATSSAADAQEPTVLQPGDTLVADSTMYVFSRAEAESLLVQMRRDSIRIATLRADSADLHTALDSTRSAYHLCAREREAWISTVEAKNEAISALEAAQPGPLADLLGGPNGLGLGIGIGFAACVAQ